RDVPDVAAGNLQPPGQPWQVEIRIDGSIWREYVLPDRQPNVFIGKGKVDHEAHTPQECLVHVLLHVRRQDYSAGELFDLLKQKSDFTIGVAIVRIPYLGTLSEQGISFVDKQDGVGSLHFLEQPLQVLIGFADILALNGGEIRGDQVQADLCGQN